MTLWTETTEPRWPVGDPGQCGTGAGQVEEAGLAAELSWMPCGDVMAEECMGTEWGLGVGLERSLWPGAGLTAGPSGILTLGSWTI